MLFALMLPTLLLSTGAAVDFARVGMLKTSMQAVTDGAALAGASALCLSNGQTDAAQAASDYYNRAPTPIARHATINTPTVTIPNTIEVTVTATSTLSNTLMRLVGLSETVSVTSSAAGPAYTLQVTKTGGFSSQAYDSDSIYFYDATSETLPTSTSEMTRIFTNDPNIDPNYVTDNASPKVISVGANDIVGFALVNITGGVTSYSPNSYGGKSGSVHMFYSTAVVPSVNAYATQPIFYTGSGTSKASYNYGYGVGNEPGCSSSATKSANTSPVLNADSGSSYPYPTWTCGAHPCVGMSGTTPLNNNLAINGACSSSTTAGLTCLQLQQNAATFAWGDMGGAVDDYDFNDAAYTVSCQPSGSVTQPNAVVLVQ